ncbi:MAG TPA: SH3 domain-containing protein [Burkholderiales bacterium]|nr:SH3 domain-containing protein [Burkholderiales bacterium]
MRTALLLVVLPIVCLAEPAVVIRATDLKQEPATDAPTVAALAENAAVDAGERKGGWTRVKAQDGAQGWVKMLLLRYGGPGTAKQGETGLSQMFNVARTGTSGTTVTTGVRGLDAEQITNAQPNAAELSRMESFAATKEASSGFAKRAKLQAKNVEYPAP